MNLDRLDRGITQCCFRNGKVSNSPWVIGSYLWCDIAHAIVVPIHHRERVVLGSGPRWRRLLVLSSLVPPLVIRQRGPGEPKAAVFSLASLAFRPASPARLQLHCKPVKRLAGIEGAGGRNRVRPDRPRGIIHTTRV